MAISKNPWKGSVSIPTGVTAVNLLTALQALDANVPTRCSGLRILSDINGAGILYIGNSNVSTIMWGDKLTSGQYSEEPMHDSNDLPLKDIWLVTDSAGTELVGISIFVK